MPPTWVGTVVADAMVSSTAVGTGSTHNVILPSIVILGTAVEVLVFRRHNRWVMRVYTCVTAALRPLDRLFV